MDRSVYFTPSANAAVAPVLEGFEDSFVSCAPGSPGQDLKIQSILKVIRITITYVICT